MVNMKYLVTGPTRTGTSLLAAILNSQKDSCCIEHDILTISDLITQQQKNIFCSRLEARFMSVGIEPPNLRSLTKKEDIIDSFLEHIKKIYSINFPGLKITRLNEQEISYAKTLGFKIILMRRNLSDVFHSMVNRSEENYEMAALHLKKGLQGINYYNLKSLEEEDYVVVDFESLINDPKRECEKLSKFLGYNIDPTVKLYSSFNKNRFEFKNNSSFGNINNVGINQQSIRRIHCEDYKKYIDFINGKFITKLIYLEKREIFSQYIKRLIK